MSGEWGLLCSRMYDSQSLKQSSSETFIMTARYSLFYAPNLCKIRKFRFCFFLLNVFSIFPWYTFELNGRTFFYLFSLSARLLRAPVIFPCSIRGSRMRCDIFQAGKLSELPKTDKKLFVCFSSQMKFLELSGSKLNFPENLKSQNSLNKKRSHLTVDYTFLDGLMWLKEDSLSLMLKQWEIYAKQLWVLFFGKCNYFICLLRILQYLIFDKQAKNKILVNYFGILASFCGLSQA